MFNLKKLHSLGPDPLNHQTHVIWGLRLSSDRNVPRNYDHHKPYVTLKPSKNHLQGSSKHLVSVINLKKYNAPASLVCEWTSDIDATLKLVDYLSIKYSSIYVHLINPYKIGVVWSIPPKHNLPVTCWLTRQPLCSCLSNMALQTICPCRPQKISNKSVFQLWWASSQLPLSRKSSNLPKTNVPVCCIISNFVNPNFSIIRQTICAYTYNVKINPSIYRNIWATKQTKTYFPFIVLLV